MHARKRKKGRKRGGRRKEEYNEKNK